jgi:hypothetical protein
MVYEDFGDLDMYKLFIFNRTRDMKRGSANITEEDEEDVVEDDEEFDEDSQRFLEEALIRAVSEDDVLSLITILNLHPIFIQTFMNDFHAEENTILYIASGNGNINIVETLLEGGADINKKNELGATPLFSAAIEGHVDIVMLLLDHGADVNCVSNDGYSSLHFAAQIGHIAVVKELLARGANIKNVSNLGITPLFIAVAESKVPMVKLLLEHGAEANHVTNNGLFALFCAADTGNLLMVEILLEFGADMNMEKQDYTPFLVADLRGHTAVTRRLAEVDYARNNARDSNIEYFKEAIKAGKLPAPLRQWIPLLLPDAREELYTWVNAIISDEVSCFAAFFHGPSTVRLRRLTNHQGVLSLAMIELLVRRSPATRKLLRDVSFYLRLTL